MGSDEKLFYKIVRLLCVLFMLTLVECLVPVGLLLLPLFLLNFAVRYATRKFSSNYGKVLTGMSSLAASDDIYEKPLYTVLLYYFVDGSIDVQQHRQLFQSKVIDSKDPSDGEECYPELKMHLTTLCGFSIWKKDPHFNINHHIKLHDNRIFNLKKGEKLDEDALMSATNEILIKPFEVKKSPWEIMIFHGAETKLCTSKEQSLIVFRYHHALSDGYSITKLMSNVTTGDYFQSPLIHKKRPAWKRLLEIVAFPFTGMFVIVVYLQHYIDNNPWGYKVNFEKEKIRDMVYFCSEAIPISQIKEIKNKVGASFNGIVLTAISGAIRKHFLQHEKTIPDHMHVGLSFPVPDHPAQKLTNHWTAAFVKLPIGLSSPRKQLDMIQKQFKTFETLLISKMPYVGAVYGGCFFRNLISYILKNLLKGSTCSMSIFPGPENLKFLSGEKITSGGFLLGPLANQGVSITVVSYNGGLRVFFGIEKSLMAPEKAKQIVGQIVQEFNNFSSK